MLNKYCLMLTRIYMHHKNTHFSEIKSELGTILNVPSRATAIVSSAEDMRSMDGSLYI